MKRNSTFDIIKGICIFLVVMTHLPWTAEERLLFYFPLWVEMAVPLFMLVSGFLYAKSFRKKDIETLENAYMSAGGDI